MLNFRHKRTVLVIILVVETLFCHKLTALVASCLWDVAGVESHTMTWSIAVPDVNYQVETHRSSAMESLELRLVGHQSGSGSRAVFWNRLWTTVVRATSPITLHRRREGSHPSLPILAVVNLSIPTVV